MIVKLVFSTYVRRHVSDFWILSNIYPSISGDKQLDGYQKKKYVCKLLFIFLLGNDVDFGHMEAVDLLASNKYTEKQIVSLIMNPHIYISKL